MSVVPIEGCTARDSTGVEETAIMLFQKNLLIEKKMKKSEEKQSSRVLLTPRTHFKTKRTFQVLTPLFLKNCNLEKGQLLPIYSMTSNYLNSDYGHIRAIIGQ